MAMNVGKKISAMQRMTVPQLRERYEEVFGEELGLSRSWSSLN